MPPIFTTIPSRCIQFSDQWSLHPFLHQEEDGNSPLAQSILNFGVLTPLLVRATGGENYEILDGRRRLRLLRLQDQDLPVCCRVVPEDTAAPDILSLLLETVGQHCRLTAIETAYFLQLCHHFQLAKETVAGLCRKLSLSPTPFSQTQLMRLLTLEPILQLGIYRGILVEQTAYELVVLSVPDRLVIYQLFLCLQLGGNKQRRLISLLREVAQREESSIAALIEGEEVQQILNHPAMNPPQKSQALAQALQKRALPALSRHEEQFTLWHNQLNLPQSCSVCHSQSFEKDEVSLTITFTDREKLAGFWGEIKDTLG